jgi:hypothetical protein
MVDIRHWRFDFIYGRVGESRKDASKLFLDQETRCKTLTRVGCVRTMQSLDENRRIGNDGRKSAGSVPGVRLPSLLCQPRDW